MTKGSMFFEALELIKKDSGLEKDEIPKEERRGIIKCPSCGNNLHYSISSYNGHIWGKCETNKCLSWMM